MEFGLRQLKNMGWNEGKGLGVKENGIVKPIALNYQSDTRGLGFSVTDELQLNNQWWTEIYNAANKGLKPHTHISSLGVVVKTLESSENENEKSEKNSRDFPYAARFVPGGSINDHDRSSERKRKKISKKKNKVQEESREEKFNLDNTNPKNFRIDLDEIFAKNKGITAHRSARLGIKMTGKMKRLQQQEAEFLRLRQS